MSRIEDISRNCREQTVHCYGTYYVFGERARRLRRRLRLLTFLGVVVPAVAGAAYMTYGDASMPSRVTLWIAGVLGLLQVIGSVWALSSKWEDAFSYALESHSANRRLFDKYNSLALNPPSDLNEAELELRFVKSENEFRTTMDEKQGISEQEQKMGMRAALRQLRMACAACKVVPVSMKPTDCDVCGNFRVWRI